MNVTEHKHGLYSCQFHYDRMDLINHCAALNDHIHNVLYPEQKTKKEWIDYISQKVEKTPTISLATQLFAMYNLLTIPNKQVHELYRNIRATFYSCYEKYHKQSIINKHFFIQSWLNVYHKGEYIDWHGHHDPKINAWHGFFCVNVEPNSKTSYRWRTGEFVDVISKNGLMVMGISNGDMHKSSEWTYNNPRITIAFDIVDSEHINSFYRQNDIVLNHWIPL